MPGKRWLTYEEYVKERYDAFIRTRDERMAAFTAAIKRDGVVGTVHLKASESTAGIIEEIKAAENTKGNAELQEREQRKQKAIWEATR